MSVASCICGIKMSEENSPYDDVTHWVGKLPKENTDSDKRTDERDTRRQAKPDILSEELGVEKKR